MENQEKALSGEESLRIITDMINKTKVSLSQSSFHLLFWGWLIFACSLSEYLLWKFTGFTHPYYVWFLVVPGVFTSVLYGIIKGRKEQVYTYATFIYVWTWMAFLFGAVVLFIITSTRMENFPSLILTMAAIPTFISGIILKFRPLIIGAAIFWIVAIIAHFAGHEVAGLAMPVAMLAGYLIPGYILKRKNHDSI
ncbi:MAG TPA: hypothetical protein VHO46_01735 [Bacteroidales bacterium]|nr:hypothetical protein [Bacteroidales bacterium]